MKMKYISVGFVLFGLVALANAQLVIDVGPVIVQTGTVAQADSANLQRGTLLMDGNNDIRYFDGTTIGGQFFGGLTQAQGDARYMNAVGTNLYVSMTSAIGPVIIADNLSVTGSSAITGDLTISEPGGGGSADVYVDGTITAYGGLVSENGVSVTSGKLSTSTDPLLDVDVGNLSFNDGRYATRHESETFVIMEPDAAFALSSTIPLKFFPEDYKYPTALTLKEVAIGVSENIVGYPVYFTIKKSASPKGTSSTTMEVVEVYESSYGDDDGSITSPTFNGGDYLFISSDMTNDVDYLMVTITYDVTI